MKETGPDGLPPVESISRAERSRERLEPAPEPYLNSIPSVLASSRMLSSVSSTELMKQAEHCGFFSMPTLNQTGELNARNWFTSRWQRSSEKARRSSSEAK